jgi:hypothetical protein
VRDNKHLQVAIRRFGYASERRRPEDCLIDLVIAAEAILLAETGDPKYRGEIRYRFATNAALAGASQKLSPDKVFLLFGDAYDQRSSLVHGSPKESKGDVASLVSVFGREMRALLSKGDFYGRGPVGDQTDFRLENAVARKALCERSSWR